MLTEKELEIVKYALSYAYANLDEINEYAKEAITEKAMATLMSKLRRLDQK
jgi:hypothetical protein